MTKTSKSVFAVLMALVIILWSALVLADENRTIHSIQIEGNQRVSDETILYYIQSKPGLPLSRNTIRNDIQQIYNLGQFKDIRVETRETLKGLDIVFLVEEIASVGRLEISGNDEIDNNEILEKIPLKRGATFQKHLIQESIEEIRALYHDKGYFFVNIKVDTRLNQGNQVDTLIRIMEGGKVAIEKIRFSGNKSLTEKELLKAMETQPKGWLSWLDDSGIYKKDVLKLDLLRIEGYYQDNGFIKIRVLEPRIDINKKNKKSTSPFLLKKAIHTK